MEWLKTLLKLIEGDQASSVIVLCITISVAWYAADAEVTSKPPSWILVITGVAMAGVFGVISRWGKCILTYLVQSQEQNQNVNDDS